MQKRWGVGLLLTLMAATNISAQQIKTDSLLVELERAAADTNKVVLYRMLTGAVRSTEPLKAVQYGKAGVALGKTLKWDKGIAGCLLNISAAYIAASRLDSALVYIDSAIDYSYRAADPNRLALAYLNRADIHMQLQNLAQSLVDCDSSLQYAEKADSDDRRARVYQTIGSVYYLQQHYPQSAEYYEKARLLYEKAGNRQMSAIVLNNQGNVYKHLGRSREAITAFNQAIETGIAIGDLNNLSMYHDNLSDVYLESRQLAMAEKYAVLAMDYAEQQQNSLQLANAWECRGRVYLAQQKFGQAVAAGLRALAIGEQDDIVNIRHEATDLLAKAYAGGGNMGLAFQYLTLNKAINDSLVKKQFDEDIAAMQTRFRVAEKDKEIKLLASEKLLQQQQLHQQRNLVFGSVAIAMLLLAAIALLISRGRLRQRMQEMELRNHIAADLHDEVGSSLSSIYMLSEMASGEEVTPAVRKDLLQRVTGYSRETMDKMGDMVWMIKPAGQEGMQLKDRMQAFLQEMCNSRNIQCRFDDNGLGTVSLSMHQKKAVYLVFKEAVNNALKYAEPSTIAVSLTYAQQQLQLTVADDGKGFHSNNIRKGNGLDNMRQRAAELGGSTDIIATPGQGTRVVFSIPVTSGD